MIEENPWWSTGEVPRELLPEKSRFAFKEIQQSFKEPFAHFIIGPRNAGKTTIIYQLINFLLKQGTNPKHILYCSLEKEPTDLVALLNDYRREILRKDLKTESAWIFLDEIHYAKDWIQKLAAIVKANPGLRVIASSSLAIDRLMPPFQEKPWFKIHRVPPLLFYEFLHFKGEKIPRVEGLEDAETFGQMLKLNLRSFVRRGFPEIIESTDTFVTRYIEEMILTRVIYRDLLEAFRIEDPGLAYRVAREILESPGQTVNVSAIAAKFNRAR
ncbi:MAG: AAA family ATPase, partial [Candidatus Hadarchaeales archaeon]